ncbi:MAG: homocysteine S-methyltransferase family protein [Gammaproteobacteria bacterium]|nr:homocysteine S-methyltransferase family protein [Gammaproteobacteria bacterium]HJL80749.1 homocysteine S-methyltransferase family protein [Gammaproteobacteria bacterium]HJM09672.1 homocysteine S-methyltransferase family protein [Gammaproteobacteria bacterium]HJN01307.1 homocysteine S-methyltransferase family protein [Gammaproteobacteria bacterium]
MKYILDSGMGTELHDRGYKVPDWKKSIWSAHALNEEPEAVLEIHKANIEAGCNVITTNNYYVTPNILKREGLENQFESLTQRSIDLAIEAKKDNPDILIALSFPPIDTSFRPDLTPSNEIITEFYERIGQIAKRQVDIILCETMSSIREGLLAATIGKNYSNRVWLSWTARGLSGESLPNGDSLSDAIEQGNELDIECQLLNCLAMDCVTEQIEILKKSKKFGIFANSAVLDHPVKDLGPDCDVDINHHSNTKSVSPKEYAREAKKWIQEGAYVVGGCCSTRPEHIREIANLEF